MEVRRCHVPGCNNRKKDRPDLTFFAKPEDPERAKIWMEQIGSPDTEEYFICEEHFEKPLVIFANHNQKYLDTKAVPTLNLPSQTDATEIGQNISVSLNTTQTTVKEEPLFTVKEELNSEAETSQGVLNEVFEKEENDDNDESPLEDPLYLRHTEPSITGKRKNNETEVLQTSKKNKNESSADAQLENADDVLTYIPNPASAPKTYMNRRVPNTSNNLKTASLKFYEYVYPDDSKQSNTKTFVESPAKDKDTNDVGTQCNSLKFGKLGQVRQVVDMNTIKEASSTTVKIHEIQVRMKAISYTSKAFRQLSLKLYLRFPKEYAILQNLFNLPCVSELKDMLKDTMITLEKDALFAKFLNAKLTCLTLEQRQCFICVGEIDIKPRLFYNTKFDQFIGIHDCDEILKPKPATKAIVLIVQGLYFEWKQLVDVGYLKDQTPTSMQSWIEKTIKALCNMGLHVRAVVTNNTSIEGFKLYYNNKFHKAGKNKYYCIKDISSLFKSFYYNFLYYDYMRSDDVVAKSIVIHKYYELDKNRNIPLTPKITNRHINPNNINELTLDQVLEVFNMTTAAAISTYIDLNILDESARPTVNLIIKMRGFYDLLSTGGFDQTKKESYVGNKSQITFLNEMLLLFDGLKLIDPSTGGLIRTGDTKKATDAYECIAKFKLLIKTIQYLFEDLKRETFQHLPIWRLNSNAAEKFSDKVQKYSKSFTKPTARAVDSVFRQIAVIQILKPCYENVSPKTLELNFILEECQNIIKFFKILHDKYDDDLVLLDENLSQILVDSSIYTSLDIKRYNGLIFIAGYLLRQGLYMHGSCSPFTAYCRLPLCDEAQNMCESIRKEIENDICVAPSLEFIDFVEAMEILFRTFMTKDTFDVVNKKIVYSLLKSLKLVKFSGPCQCMPLHYMKKVYVRFRINHTLKYNNQRIKKACERGIVINKL